MSMLDAGWAAALDHVNAALGTPPRAPVHVDPESAIAALPPAARDLFLALRARRDDLQAARIAAADRRNEALERIAGISAHLGTMVGLNVTGVRLLEDHPSVISGREKLRLAEATLARLVAHHNALASQWAPLERLIARAEQFICGGGQQTAYEGEIEPQRRNETPAAAASRQLRAELAKIETAPLPLQQAKERARSEVATLGNPR
jgi:hypothetical protein